MNDLFPETSTPKQMADLRHHKRRTTLWVLAIDITLALCICAGVLAVGFVAAGIEFLIKRYGG